MCELFGLSSGEAIQPSAALNAFRLRGGRLADNPDGWGVAFLADGTFRLVKEPVAAIRSTLFAKLSESVRSSLIVAHVRKANYPPINTLANTHPFKEPCCGKDWVFAHNGVVPGVMHPNDAEHKAICVPAGQTDSEQAFCHFLTEVAQHFPAGNRRNNRSWFRALGRVSEAVASLGKFNFLMSEGEHLLAYGHDRLHFLEHHRSRGSEPDIALIATEPLPPYDGWQAFSAGELRIYRRGRLVARLHTAPARRPGRGESSQA
ncbi:MAG: class II glutamine amidotransferase [Betaproteobacteria bacterium]|nr:class II glutamine amidotransferase [Betaproteobacteria bacterium]